MSAYDKQVGGNHYTKMKIQPIEFTNLVGGTCCFCKMLKYTKRNKYNKVEDLEKAIDVVNKEKEDAGLIKENYKGKVFGNKFLELTNDFTDDPILILAIIHMHHGMYEECLTELNKLLNIAVQETEGCE